MPGLKEKLMEELKEAMKSGNADRVSVIRMLRATIKNREIDRGKGSELNDADVTEVLISAVKQRRDSIEQFAKGNRQDLVDQEKKELEILQSFLPQAMPEEELRALVKKVIAETGAAGIRDMGKVMKSLMPLILGRADNSFVSQLVKEALNR
ncbi:MAG TPA: GatB/YqeY domain-containing protein [Nitrospiria bacterium]|nr:GatB/YqeY domain-containing protein [Nitrospiria bacterium]